MKKVMATFFLLLLAISRWPSQAALPRSPASQSIPQSAAVTIRLLKAPGLNLPGSNWQIDYEFRITNEIGVWQAAKKGQLRDETRERVGDLVKQGAARNSLESVKGQTLVLKIPFTPNTLERLRNQPKQRIELTAATATPENIKLNQEQELTSQVFLFYAIVRIRDARLNKSLTIPVSRMWDYMNFPEAQFEVSIEIDDNERINVRSSSLKTRAITIQRRTK